MTPTRQDQLSFSAFGVEQAKRGTPDPVARLRTLDEHRRQAHMLLKDGAALTDLTDAQLFALDDGTREIDALIALMGEEAKARTDEVFSLGQPL